MFFKAKQLMGPHAELQHSELFRLNNVWFSAFQLLKPIDTWDGPSQLGSSLFSDKTEAFWMVLVDRPVLCRPAGIDLSHYENNTLPCWVSSVLTRVFAASCLPNRIFYDKIATLILILWIHAFSGSFLLWTHKAYIISSHWFNEVCLHSLWSEPHQSQSASLQRPWFSRGPEFSWSLDQTRTKPSRWMHPGSEKKKSSDKQVRNELVRVPVPPGFRF